MYDSLISRKAAIDALYKEIIKKRVLGEDDYDGMLDEFDTEDILKKVPSAQPERKTAEWVYGEKDGADGWFCSECGFHVPWYYDYYGLDNIDFIRDYHTCPCCDSKMLKYTGMKEEEQ